jgi:hypothetical protein
MVKMYRKKSSAQMNRRKGERVVKKGSMFCNKKY